MANGDTGDTPQPREGGNSRRPRPPSRRYSLPERFFLYMSKTDLHVLQFCTPETHMTQISIGVMVVITGILAFISGYFAVHSSFFAKETSVFAYVWSVSIAAIYAFTIAWFDREVVAVTSRWAAVPRLILAMFLGVVIAFPLELKLMEGRIDAQISHLVEERNAGKVDQMQGIITSIERMQTVDRSERIRPHVQNVKSLEEFVALAQDEYDRERKRVACRQRCQQRLEELKDARKQLAVARQKLDVIKAQFDRELQERITSEQRRLNVIRGELDEEKRASHDFLSQAIALHSLTASSATASAVSWFLKIFFVILESFPVLIKLFLPYSEYNAYLDARRQLNVAKINTIANKRLRQLEDHPDREHVLDVEETDMFEDAMEDRVVDIEPHPDGDRPTNQR